MTPISILNGHSRSSAWHNRYVLGSLIACVLSLPGFALKAQAPSQEVPASPPPTTLQNSEVPPPAHVGTLVDQVVAIVNGDLVLESDLDEERRFQAFQPLRATPNQYSRADAIERLIDRALILQQSKSQPDNEVKVEEARAQLLALRKDIPACREFNCETAGGWEKFVAAQGFTVPELEEHWQERMEILKFIEVRFQSGIRISPAEIKAYYDKTLLPQSRAQRASAPPLESISDRIQEILLQQQVSNLIGDWLKTLKAEGSVRVIKPGEVTP